MTRHQFQPGDRVYWIRSKRLENSESGQQVPAVVTSIDGEEVKLELRTCPMFSDKVIKAEVVLPQTDIEPREIPSALFEEPMQFVTNGFEVGIIHCSQMGVKRLDAWYGTVCSVPVTQPCKSQDIALVSALRTLSSGSISDRMKPLVLAAKKDPASPLAQRVLALNDRLAEHAHLFTKARSDDAVDPLRDDQEPGLDDEEFDLELPTLA